MGRVLAMVGVIVTAGYLVFAWWLVGDRIYSLQTMGLNEVGDFLAGAFGPLAILWLVLGFFQQGVELRQGTAALKMQAEELRASVQQQSAMVDVSRQQLLAAIAAAQYEKELNERNCEPHTEFKYKYMVTKGATNYATFSIFNTGPRCGSLTVSISESETDQKILTYQDVFANKEVEFDISEREISISEAKKITLSYTKNNGTVSHETYGVQKIKPKYTDAYVQVFKFSN